MTNSFYNRVAEFVRRTTAKSIDVKNELDAVSAGFDLLPEPRNDGQGFIAAIAIGDATETYHAVTKGQMDVLITSNEQNKIDSEQASETALSAANMKGDWSTQSGAATPPYSVIHNQRFWILRLAVTDVSLEEPINDDGSWIELQVQKTVPVPKIISPINGSLDVGISPELTAASYQHIYGTARSGRRFQIDLAMNDYSNPLYDITEDSDSIITTVTLDNLTQYKWRCKDESPTANSAWSLSQLFTTAATTIDTPSLIVEGSPSSLEKSPTLTMSAFSVSNGSDTHESTDWEVLEAGIVIYSSLSDTANLTSLTVPSGVLSANTVYTFRARQRGAALGDSSYILVNASTVAEFEVLPVLFRSKAGSPRTNIYIQDVDTFTEAAINPLPATLISSAAKSISFSSDRKYIAHADSSALLGIYKREINTYTQIPYTATNAIYSTAFSRTNMLLFSHYTVPRLRAVIIDDATLALTDVVITGSQPNATVQNIAVSGDGNYIAIRTASLVYIYKRTGNALAYITLFGASANSSKISFNYDGSILIVSEVAASTIGRVRIYTRSGSAFTGQPQPSLPEWPVSTYGNAMISPDGRYLATIENNVVSIFSMDGAIPTHLFSSTGGNVGATSHMDWSEDGEYLFVANNSIQVFKETVTGFELLPQSTDMLYNEATSEITYMGDI
jgi:hypothetical protein